MELRRCWDCGLTKTVSEFYPKKKGCPDLTTICKICGNRRAKEWRRANKERIKETSKEWRKKNPEKQSKISERRRKKNPEKEAERIRAWRKKNPESHRKYYHKNKEEIRQKQRDRLESDHLFKLRKTVRNRIGVALRDGGYQKQCKTSEMLGCDWQTLVEHLESQFTEGMSWENMGEWHVDHRVPLSSANTPEELEALCHYTNLQPLWAKDNLSKGSKTD